MGESSTTLHLIVKTQLNVIVEPDLLVADFGSNAEFTCKAYRRDEDEEESQGEKTQRPKSSLQKKILSEKFYKIRYA